MKRTLLLIGVAFLSVCGVASAQFSTYVKAMSGDTAIIKDYNDMGGVANSLTNALNSDTGKTVPADRVYELETNGYYPLTSNPTTAARGVVIVGQSTTPIVSSTNTASAAPPLICGSTISGAGSNTGGINWGGALTIKNCEMEPAVSDGSLGWAFLGAAAANCRVVLDNDMFEHTRWIEANSNGYNGCALYISDCYFVNLSGQGCRRNGGVYDNVDHYTDTIWVENSTHVMTEGSMYKFRQFPIKHLFFNHNTFVNCAGSIFESLGYESNLTVTNNIFVNSNVQPTCDSILVWDTGETDPGLLPTGLVNCAPLPDTVTATDRKILVDRNVVYWDPKFNNLDSILIANKAEGSIKWVSQMITMNTRTQAMFDSSTAYPYLDEGTWYKELPTFVNPQNLLSAEVDSIKAYCISTLSQGNNGGAILSDWRVSSLEPSGNTSHYIYSDWPIPLDLSYTNSDLLAGGTLGEPVGDLNWFPTQKAALNWTKEHAALETMLENGTLVSVKSHGTVPGSFALSQNYPNPFNPSTVINFTIPEAGNVTLKVYNVLGQEVATLMDGFKAAQTYQVKFDGSNLSTGVYFYTLKTGDQSITKKMLLLK